VSKSSCCTRSRQADRPDLRGFLDCAADDFKGSFAQQTIKRVQLAPSVYSRTLRKAAELIGSREKLSRYLQVPPSNLGKWIADEARPPMAIFLRAVDLVLQETPVPPGDADAGDPPAPRDCSSATGSSAPY
jgi:hypothetical protein